MQELTVVVKAKQLADLHNHKNLKLQKIPQKV